MSLFVTLLAACASGASLPAVPSAASSPSAEHTPTAVPTVLALTGTPPSPSAATVAVRATHPVGAMPVDRLLFQPGDLPNDVRASTLDRATPDWMNVKLPKIDAAAGLHLERSGTPLGYGRVQLLFENDASRVQDLYQRLIAFEASGRQGVPQPGLGDEALLFLPQDPFAMLLFFHRCRTVADIQLRISPSEQPILLNYAARLAQRVDAVDCQGAAHAPVLTPPPPLPTWTPIPRVAIAQVISATVARLPDPSGTNTIRAAAFADANHGWLALGAKIIATSDGGMTWLAQFEADSRVLDMDFVSPQVGWIALQNGYLVTRDAGATWQRANARPDDGKMPPPLIKRAPNGEPTFEFCGDNASFAGPFAAIDQQTAWAFCTSGGGDHYMLGVRLFQTRDGGKHWQMIADRPPYTRYGLPDLFFLDEKHGWMGSDSGGDGYVRATIDGGRTWKTIAEGGGDPRNIQFLTPRQGFVVFPFSTYNNDREALQRTDDAGATWRAIYSVPPRAPWPGGPTEFFADGTGIGAGDGQYRTAGDLSNNTLLSTDDAGQSWAEVAVLKGWCPGDYAVRIGGLSFADRQHGWFLLNCVALPQPILYRTGDGGSTWQSLALPSGINGVTKGISFVDQETGFIVTGDGRLWRTDDGGATFAPVDDLAVHTPSLRFATKDVGWEIRGVDLFATSDGGHHWKPIALGDPVQAFSLLPDGRAWVVLGDTPSAANPDPARRLLTTADDGRTWTEYQLDDLPVNWQYPWLDTIQFADAEHGWLKADTALYYTQDGGRHWVQFR
jgi:photosystem II stability/assembly factor-like uncharacterized protein